MSKPIKNLIAANYRQKFAEVEGAVLIDIRGITSNDNNKLRANLAQKNIRVTVVQNNLARVAFADTELKALENLLSGPSALVYGGSSVVEVARELIERVKEIPSIQFKGALMDGQLFPADQISALSKYPTKEEAQGQVVQLFLSPARKLAGQIAGPAGKLAGYIKAVEEKLEKGETIAKVG